MDNSRPRSTIHWRATTSRLLLGYGVFFVIWGTVLLGLIYWQTVSYLDNRTDLALQQQISYLRRLEGTRLRLALDDYLVLQDTNYSNAWGVFEANGKYIDGTMLKLPAGLKMDDLPQRMPTNAEFDGRDVPKTVTLYVIASYLPDGHILALAHATRVTARVSIIIRNALWWGLSFTLVPGLIGGLLLNLGPRRRIRLIEEAIHPIVRGNLRARLPVSHRDDELDRLADIVNGMLEQIERLMGEVKGVCDNIAHDLRTPLTRLRSQLYRVQQQMADDDSHAALVDRCVGDVDEVLARFRALLRISELEDLRRREGFLLVDVGQTLQHVHELYVPIAEDSQVQFSLDVREGLIAQADPDLLFEAFGNLVANAIKFTPPGGQVILSAQPVSDDIARIEVADSGPGIPLEQREAVWRRFYRGESQRDTTGHGLGLSIVAAIAKLHDFPLQIDGDEHGTRISMDIRLRG